MNLILDLGNTRDKLAVFRGDELVAKKLFAQLSVTELAKAISKFPVCNCILSSVIRSDKPLRDFAGKQFHLIQLSHKTSLPFKNFYTTPQTLGNDRLANAAGAIKFFRNKNVLIVDMGTCIKYDFINAKKEYLGGSISPGLEMRFEALHDYTQKLPLVKSRLQKKIIGSSTQESILTGVQQGIINEMNGFISLYKKKIPLS